jgi:3-oxoacyl-(acyl-carrier-protein) synthase
MILAVTGLGLCSPLGTCPEEVAAALSRGETALRAHSPLDCLPGGPMAGVVEGPDARPFLRKRKDRKLLSRASTLSLVAAAAALGDWPGDREQLGLFWGVGREPPDDGDCEATLAAACQDGSLSEERLAARGRDLYPPLLPLKTLPNMALAHISINLGLCGENGAWAGGAEAGLLAIREGCWSILEGRAPAALVGAGDSLVDLGSARDRLRSARVGAPGEAAAALLIEPLDTAWSRAARLICLIELEPDGSRPSEALWGLNEHRAAIGDCGAADGALAVLLGAVCVHREGRNASVRAGTMAEGSRGIRLRKPGPC